MLKMKPSAVVAVLSLSLIGAVGAARAEVLQFRAVLAGAEEVPPNNETAQGNVSAALDTATKVLTYRASYEGTTGPGLMAHFHGPAAPGATAPPTLPVPAAASPIAGKATLSDAQIADLKAGLWYFNVHTTAHKGGELRGQLMPTP